MTSLVAGTFRSDKLRKQRQTQAEHLPLPRPEGLVDDAQRPPIARLTTSGASGAHVQQINEDLPALSLVRSQRRQVRWAVGVDGEWEWERGESSATRPVFPFPHVRSARRDASAAHGLFTGPRPANRGLGVCFAAYYLRYQVCVARLASVSASAPPPPGHFFRLRRAERPIMRVFTVHTCIRAYIQFQIYISINYEL